MGAPTSSYATAGIALKVSGALKPHHHDKVETPSMWFFYSTSYKNNSRPKGIVTYYAILSDCLVSCFALIILLPKIPWSMRRLGRG
jgi:hypothetical protein